FAAPARNRFAYQLVGFDENWVSTDAGKRFATYTNLDPGTYEFRVKAANKDGAWSGSSATLTIHVLPPFWKSWWFRTLMLTLAIGSAYAAFRVRMSGLRRQKNQLEQQVLARTDEIGQQNRLLLYQKHELEARRIEADTQRRDAERRHADAERQKQEVELQKENVELAHRNISILSEIGREMTATLDMETIMSTMYRHVQHLMDARMFGIGFCHEERGVIEFPFALDHGVRSQFYTRSMDEPRQLAVWCVSERREIFINNMATELPHYIGAAGARSLAPADLIDGTAPSAPVSVMYVPLIVKDRVMGVMSVQSIEANAYRRVHMDMLQTLAAHAAVALDNARAYRELEQTQARLLEQERKVRANTDELAEANRALQDNDERLRLAKQRAEEATRQKSEFLANMSHEMRTPLAGVIGMLGFALRDNRLQDATRDQILRGQANAQSLLAIINDLLDLSKIEAGKLNTENIDFALGAALDHVASLFEQQAAISGIGFDIELAPDLPRFVVGDPTRLRQVLVNLVGNAFKFTHQGAVRVSVQRCADVLPARGQVSMIRFSVQDTGIGISPAALARLFQKFEQADTTTTRRYGGTGLGLAICRQLVELMGGQISVDSVEGEGSSFSFVLPLADGVAPPAPSSAPLPPHSHRLKVLCAEDFPTNQIIIRTMLEELGHEVEMADDGLQAVQACVRTRHDLILMDGRMPQLDGASATRMIRAGGLERTPVRDRDLMIIALTANASEEDRARYLACGMDDFLTKPVDEAALHAQLARAIERQLARGIALEPMAPRRAPASAAELAALDELFGVAPGPAPQAPPGALNERVRAAFMADLPLRLAELNAARAAQDHEAAGRVLHGLSGSAAYLQADELRGWCGALSRAADRRQWDLLDAGLPRLHALLGVFADKVT
ncbi:MAG: ATP-binding protein, partial [Massilia sp.]